MSTKQALIVALAASAMVLAAALDLSQPVHGKTTPSLKSVAAAALPIISWEWDQIKPAVAYNSQANAYLVVWEDHHWGLGENWSINGRRVGTDGAPIGGLISISYHGANHVLAPDVVYNPAHGEYLVVWEYEVSSGDHDIYARRVASDGTLLSDEIAIATASNLESNPKVTYNSQDDGYLVVWERRAGSDPGSQVAVYARRLDAGATPAGGSFAVTSGLLDTLAPAVAHGSVNNQYLVVWQEEVAPTGTRAAAVAASTTLEFDIYAQRIASNGSLVGSQISISTWEHDQVKPRLAFNSQANEFLVVWEDHHWEWGQARDIHGQRVRANGTLVGGVFGISWDGPKARLSPDVAYHTAAGEYLVVWEYEESTIDHDVKRRRVGSDGALLDSEVVVSNHGGHEGSPAVSAGSGRSHLVVWEDGRQIGTMKLDIYGDIVTVPAPTPTNTPTSTATRTRTRTPTRTSTPTPAATSTKTGTPSPTKSATPTVTRTATVTRTPTATATPSRTPTRTHTPTSTPILPAQEPSDLVCTDVWPEDGRICFQLRNIGEGVAARGHEVALYVDGAYQKSAVIDADLAPGARWQGCFDYAWSCAGQDDEVMIWADRSQHLAESDETNNRKQERWGCDAVAPRITSGPEAEQVTADSAVIAWETNEESDSRVDYGLVAWTYAHHRSAAAFVTRHDVRLDGLQASGTYHFKVQSTDRSGNAVQSRDVSFRTLPLPDSESPSIVLQSPGVLRGTSVVRAEVMDNVGVDRVEFYMNDVPWFADYSDPYEFPVDSRLLANGGHTLTAKAVDLSGRFAVRDLAVEVQNPIDVTAPHVEITSPTEGAIVGGVFPVVASLTDDLGLSLACVFMDGIPLACEWYPENPTNKVASLHLDTFKLENRRYRLVVQAYDLEFRPGLKAMDVVVYNAPPPPAPKLVVTRHEVSRSDNRFDVLLSVKNVGALAAKNVVIEDWMRGFQPVSSQAPTADYRAVYLLGVSVMRIRHHADIPPSGSATFAYQAAPVLEHPNPAQLVIGRLVSLDYVGPDGTGYYDSAALPVLHTNDGDALVQAHRKAVATANYLIVTSPFRLLMYYPVPVNDLNELLSTMADLALHKQGVVGYLHRYDEQALRALLDPLNPASWAKKLHPGFSQSLGGYLLIVGETEIVPSAPPKGDFTVGWGDVCYSDQLYADTGGDPAPDLIVGRAIGDSAATLARPLKTSIGVQDNASGYAFLRDRALLVTDSGFGDFSSDADKVGGILEPEFRVSRMDWKDYFLVHEYRRLTDPTDGFAVGELVGGGLPEVVIANQRDKHIYVCTSSMTPLQDWYAGFEDGDRIAIANNTVILADSSAGRIRKYSAYGHLGPEFPVYFEAHDGLAAGDVRGDGSEEILIASHSADKVIVYTFDGVKELEFAHAYHRGDGFAVGDVWGDDKEEIVLASVDQDTLYVYDRYGLLKTSRSDDPGEFDMQFDHGHSLAVGNIYVSGDPALTDKAEILLADRSTRVLAFRWDDGQAKLVEAGSVPGSPTLFVDLEAGEAGGFPGDEVLVRGWTNLRVLDTYGIHRMQTSFPGMVRHQDVIAYFGHGGVRGWGEAGGIGTGGPGFPPDFGQHNPLVLSMACLTGNYEDQSDAYNLAESMLSTGAAVFIGATQLSVGGHNREFACQFFSEWRPFDTIGKAFTEVERTFWKGSPTDDWWWFWAYEYNLYGDPKFGAGPAVHGGSAPVAAEAQPPPTSLDIVVPDYVLGSANEFDRAEIPGGRLWMERGQLWIPYYSASFDYPKGYQVQGVTLVERSGLTTTTGLNLPMTPLTVTPSVVDPVPYSGPVQDWFPQDDYRWVVLHNADGSSTLVVTLYPFYYNHLTTDVRFYQNYRLAVEYMTSGTAITQLETEREAYSRGERVGVTLGLSHSGQPKDVVVNAVVKRCGTEDLVAGSLLRTLQGLSGPASFSLQWDSTGAAAGDYYVEVTLQDGQGKVLAVQERLVRLGILSGEITSLRATPLHFEPGQPVAIDLAFGNTGTASIHGAAVIQVRHSGAVLQEFRHAIENLAPGSMVHFDDIWQTSATGRGTYTVLGYVQYAGRTSDAVSVEVRTTLGEARVFLPIVVKNSPAF